MHVPVRTVRLKARRVATIEVAGEDGVRDALRRLRSWALTRGFAIASRMSWLLPLETGASIQVRCPVGEDADVHPDVGIELRRVPSAYVALVEVRDPGTKPPALAAKLSDWAFENGYRRPGYAEVFIVPEAREFDVALPIERRPRTRFIDV